MNLNDDVVNRRRRLGPLHQRHPGRSCSLVRHHNRLHPAPPGVELSPVTLLHRRLMCSAVGEATALRWYPAAERVGAMPAPSEKQALNTKTAMHPLLATSATDGPERGELPVSAS